MKNLAIKIHRDFPSSPVVRTFVSNVVGVGSVLGRGTKTHIPHSGAKNQTNKNKQKTEGKPIKFTSRSFLLKRKSSLFIEKSLSHSLMC